jgi:hypothetical protein
MFCTDPVFIAQTTLHRAFFSPAFTPIVSPIFSSCSIPQKSLCAMTAGKLPISSFNVPAISAFSAFPKSSHVL